MSDRAQCLKIKLKPGKTEYAIAWIKNLYNQSEEVKQVLSNEGIIVESIFLEKGSDGEYLILYQKTENLLKAYASFNISNHPLEVATKLFINDCWKDIQSLEVLFDT
ncbi:DUF6176 family protein [Brasilonema sp. UFV-L1]|uniref:DUF6176 family protein n=1 Tax=Brasilonema sp. UFV-L1 TaxID=2234130 RepID=UPI00145DF249|nr:hypothetical protein [Brasilonema sp. UFV-L1]